MMAEADGSTENFFKRMMFSMGKIDDDTRLSSEIEGKPMGKKKNHVK